MNIFINIILIIGLCITPFSRSQELKIVKDETHFNPPTAFGAPKPPWMAKLDAIGKAYANAFLKKNRVDAILELFADSGKGGIWIDPVGQVNNTFIGIDEITNLWSQIPKITFSENQEIFYTASSKIFLAKTKIQMERASGPTIILDILEVNDDMKIVKIQTHFNPPTAFGAKRPPWMDEMDKFAQTYLDAYSYPIIQQTNRTDAFLALFENDGDEAIWIDPVGGTQPPWTGRSGITKLFSGIPKVTSSNLKEIYYTASSKIFLIKYEIVMVGASGPTIIVDRLTLA
eukprot:g12547.t1